MEHKKQKVWFVTGASKGMGLALTRYLLANGQKVAATSRNAGSIRSQIDDDNLLALTVDLTSESDVRQAIEKTLQTFDAIDIVVNNAGYGLVGAMEELTDAEFRQTFDVNLFGTIRVIRAALPHLRKQKRGHIINISSISGYIGAAYSGSYDAAKSAVISISEALKQEIAGFGIHVTVAIPGLFRTDFMNDSSLQITGNQLVEYSSVEQMKMWKQYSGQQPGDPQKLAKVLFDISELKEPPLHLLLGSDAYELATSKMNAMLEEFEQWKTTSKATSFD